METAKLIDFTVLIFTLKTESISKANDLNIFFIKMPDTEVRAALIACCLNNIYGFYASPPTFLNFLIM